MKEWFFIVLLMVPIVSASTADFYVMNVSPDKVYPGEIVTVNITIKNLGTDYAAYLRASFDPDGTSPFTALSSPKKFLGKAAGAVESMEYFGVVRQSDELILQYQVKVKDNAAIGAYQIPIVLNWEDARKEEKSQIIYVGVIVEGEPNLVIAGVNTSPERVYPDQEFSLVLGVENIGDEDAKAVEARLVMPEEFSGEGSGYIGTLEKDKKVSLSFDLKASKKAESRAYDFTLILIYYNEEGVLKKVERPFQIFVSSYGDVDLEIAGISTSPSKIYPGTDFTLSVQLENIGTQDAKSVMATISNTEGFVGEFSSFIGKIEVDDVSSGIFDLRATKSVAPGDHTFKMKIVYTDEKGDEFYDTKTFSIYVDEPPRKKVYYIAVPLIILALILVVVWRYKKAASQVIEG